MDSDTQNPGQPSRKRRRLSSVLAMPSNGTPHPELGHMRSNSATGSTSFVGSGSGIAFVQTVRSALARNMSWDNNVVESELVPGEDDNVTTRNSTDSLWFPDEIAAAEQQRTISFDDLVYWSQPYFNIWHPPFPFLHAPSILGMFEKISTSGLQALSDIESTIVQSVLSISVADRRQLSKDDQDTASLIPPSLLFGTLDEAISCISLLLARSSTLLGLQAAMSVQLFLVSVLRLNTASRFGGLIVRMAFHLGLHRCPSRYKQFSASQAEMRRRVFWTIYSVEMFLAQSLGLPVTLKDEDIDVCLHGDEKHVAIRTDGNSTDTRRFRLPAFIARNSRIKGLILELRHKSINHRNTDPDEVAHIDAEISRWWNEVQDFVDPLYLDDGELDQAQPGSSDVLRTSHRLLLIVQKHESIILLNRPVITSGHNTFAVSAAMQRCIGASKAIILNTYQHLQESMKNDRSQDGRISNPLFWPGFTWSVWMSGLILLYAASNGFYSVDAAQREASRCVKLLDNLSMRRIFWPGACSAAIKDLQHALSQKASNNSPTKHSEMPSTRQQDTHNTSITGNRRISESTSMQDQLNGTPVINQPLSINNNISAPTSSMLDNPTTDSVPALPSFQDDAAFLQDWPAMNGQFLPMENSFTDFDDIFQFMDVPYHLNDLT